MTETHPTRATEAFWGRRLGKPLRPMQAAAMETVLPERLVDVARPAPGDLRTLFGAQVDAVRLEIGFGGGEHLLREAEAHPRTGFIGVEPFVNGMAKMAMRLSEAPLPNVRLFHDDATLLLDWLPDASLGWIDLLYPDPWPKTRHWKRRFVSGRNLDRFARVLKPGGRFCFASDIDTYVDWTLAHTRDHDAFDWPARSSLDWLTSYEGWAPTRYEEKARREGRSSAYLTFIRR
ncbi:MAG: tRNA (guanosine(46)-N7)-methyltransferase TrmB [Methylobacterium mesophilicum]|nr:tRNA (guanosine(46)-N7)-methyltransferase TrmB [Methylobacterium mesophilicum]